MPQRKEFPSLKVRNQNIETLYSLNINNEFILETKPRDQIDKISIVNDDMFHTMFNHPNGKKYVSFILSKLLDVDNNKLLKDMQIISNDVPKNNKKILSQKCDFVCQIDNTVITIEMNNNSSIEILHRNMDYNNKQFNAIVKNSKNYNKYRQSILINFNNFAFLGKDKTYYIYYLKDEDGTVLTDAIIIINIYIPNLRKKCYALGIEGLDEIEKFIYAQIEEDNDKLDSLMREMEIVKEYVSDATSLTNNDDDLKFNYDRELATREELQYVWEEKAFDRGLKQGIEQAKQEKIAMIKAMFAKDLTIEFIADCVNMSIKDIKNILGIR